MGCPWKERFETVTSSRTQPHLVCTVIFRCLREGLRPHGESRIHGSSGVCDNPATQKTFRYNSIRPRPQGCESGMGPSCRSFAGIPGVNLAAKKTVAMPSLPARPGKASCARNPSLIANLPKHQSGRAFTKRLLPQASSVASHPRCALSRSGTASFPVLPFRADAYQNPLLRFVRSSFSPACV